MESWIEKFGEVEKFASRIRELSDEELGLCSYVHAGRYSDVDMDCSCYEAGFEYDQDPGNLAEWRERWGCDNPNHWLRAVVQREVDKRGLDLELDGEQKSMLSMFYDEFAEAHGDAEPRYEEIFAHYVEGQRQGLRD